MGEQLDIQLTGFSGNSINHAAIVAAQWAMHRPCLLQCSACRNPQTRCDWIRLVGFVSGFPVQRGDGYPNTGRNGDCDKPDEPGCELGAADIGRRENEQG